MIAHKIEGWMRPEELDWIAAQAKHAKVIVEIGCWKGRSTAAWCEHTTGIVIAVDHWRPETTGSGSYQESYDNGRESIIAQAKANLRPFLEAGRLLVVESESVTAAAMLAPFLSWRKADIVFIDGDHAVARVMDDIAAYRPLVRPGGILCGHDYGEVCEALTSIKGMRMPAGDIWSTVVL